MRASRRACRERSWSVGALVVLLLAGCSGDPALAVRVPSGHAGGCARLHHALPSELDGRSARDVTPTSDRTAAWGSPAVVLRCGVTRPEALTPTSELVEVNGVDWFLDERSSAYVFTRVDHRPYVEVRVPGSVDRTAATAPLVDLARAISDR